jgi:RNA polymerase sigma factor (sigma-70 family)
MDTADRAALHADLSRLALGDRGALDAVFDRAQPPARALAGRMLSRPEDAEEAAQQALLKVFERAGEFDPSRGDALAWILGVVAWECRTIRQRHRRSREDATEAPLRWATASGHSPEEAAERRELLAALEAVMGTLRPADRAVLEAALERRSRPAIAAGTFRQRLRRARMRLQAAWEALDAG